MSTKNPFGKPAKGIFSF